MFQDLLKRMLSFPQRRQIKIDFDRKAKIFRLSVPIFSSQAMPSSVKNYVESRKGAVFKPHLTSFREEDGSIVLNQEFPFGSDFQETLRQRIDAFWKVSRHCHQMMAEMAVEETYQSALHLDSDSV